jgi:tetratricopeptide (TPR) repeat protein
MSDESTTDRAELLRRRRSAFETLVQRAQIVPGDADLIRQLLTADNLDSLWEGALDAATIASQSSGDAAVYRAIDMALAQSLRERPNLNVVIDLYNRLPRDTVAMQETAIEVARQTVVASEERGLDRQHPDQFLILLNNYVGRLLQASRWVDAGTEAKKALEIGREGYKSDSSRFAAELAQSLENAVTLAMSLGRSTDAVAPMDEALAIYRELAKGGSFESRRSLAICLNNRIHLFDSLGRFDEAVESGEEAVRLFRAMIPADRREFHPSNLADWVSNVQSDLATCLLALSTALNKARRYLESLAAAEEAVQALSALASDYPDYFRPLLGQAYNNWAMGLDSLGKSAEATEKAVEAVAIFRDLDKIRAEVYRPYLAHVLVAESLALGKSDRLPEAVDVAHEALDLYEALAQSRAEIFTANVLQACDNLVTMLRELGREEEAVHIHTRIQQSYRPKLTQQ